VFLQEIGGKMFTIFFGLILGAMAEEPDQEAPKENKKDEKKDKTRWKVRPHVDPTINLHTFSTETNTYYGANVGGSVGARYQQKKNGFRWQGLTRASYVQTWGPNVSGQDIRVGSFMGPWWRVVGLQVGPDVFYNAYDNPGVEIPEVIGLATPASATVDLKVVNLHASVAPSFYLSGDREGVNWERQEFPGFGDEFTYTVGAGLDLWVVGFGLSYTRRITSFGDESSVGFGVSFF